MKNTFTFILSIFALLTLSACDDMSDIPTNNTNQNETAIVSEPPDISPSNPNESTDSPPVSELPAGSESSNTQAQVGNGENNMIDISITVGSSVFSAKLFDNETSDALLAIFPITLDMSDLHRNEKYYYLSERLPMSSERVGNIRTGDIMLYGADCLVLFYEDFSTSYSYTKLGFIDDASGLSDALGEGGVQITFAVSE